MLDDVAQPAVPLAPNCQPCGKAFVVDVCVIPLKFCEYEVPDSVAAVVAWARDSVAKTMHQAPEAKTKSLTR
ncbi:MAG: hypothetical protein ACKON7_12100 [Planctomycetaceae bacterium]